MKIIRSPIKMQQIALGLARKGKSIGLVPTMGALHEGHLSLIRKARKSDEVVVVSIFVNPKQFGPKEDYIRYPRPFRKDVVSCKKGKVDYVFAPSADSLYPSDYKTFVRVEELSEMLCGKFRPVHFRGVTTVVAKLFNIIRPQNAYFGMKDYQQLKIIEQMARDLNFPVNIIPCQIIREKDGLALSSRNQYLSKKERFISANINKSLQFARYLIKSKKLKNAYKIEEIIKKSIKKLPDSKIDYIEILDARTLEHIKKIEFPLVIAVAVWIGKTRLIDNLKIV